MSNIGGWEIALVVLLALIIFGPKKLPELGSSLGRSIRGFRKGLKEGKEEVQATVSEVRQAAGVDEVKATVAEMREAVDVKKMMATEEKSTVLAEGKPGAGEETAPARPDSASPQGEDE